MKKSNVDLKWKVLSDIHTGMAYIYVNAEGDNSIVIYGGANMAFGNNELDP
jgi:sugar/nucleoside kinase (ribokinase family)